MACCSSKYPPRALATLQTQRASVQVLFGRKVFAVPTASAPRRFSNERSSCTGASIFFRATTILPASQRQSSRPMASWPEYWMLRRIACPGRLTPRHSSPWRQPRSRMDCSANILAANRAAGILLQGLPTSPGRRFTDVFRTKFSAFVDEGRRKERQRLEDEVGSQFVSPIEHTRQFPLIH